MRWILPICALALLSCEEGGAPRGATSGTNVIDRGEGEAGDDSEDPDGGGAEDGGDDVQAPEAGEGEAPEVGEGEGEVGEADVVGEGEGEGEGEPPCPDGTRPADGECLPGEGEGEGEGGDGPIVVADCAVENDDGCVFPRARGEAQVCDRYLRDYPARAAAPIWSSDAGECSAGELTAEARADALRRVNLYRWLAGLDPVDDAPAMTPEVQQCALMQSTAGTLDHFPPDDWACFTAQGAAQAGRSNLSIGQTTAGGAVDSQMIDAGDSNEDVLGHRRWILYRPLTEVAIGYAHTGDRPATCVHVVPEPFVANDLQGFDGLVVWPPAGVAPFELVHPPNARGNVLRWSVIAANVQFAGATASVFIEETPGTPSPDDAVFPVESGPLEELLEDGLWIEPREAVQPGATYRIEISGASIGDFAWRTTFAPCGLVVPALCDPVVQDCPLPGTACYGLDGPTCKDTALPREGEDCVFDRQCPRGTTCAQWPDEGNICSAYCSTAPEPPEGLDCGTVCGGGLHIIDAARNWAICRPPQG